MNTDYLLLVVPFCIVFLYKASFWLYVIQLKEYRIDRFSEYSKTTQGKGALFNFWFVLELCVFLLAFALLIDPKLEIMYYPMAFFFLIFESIFVFGKIIRKRQLVPKITGRLLVTIIPLSLIFLGLLVSILFTKNNFIPYFLIFLSFLLLPLIIFCSIFITLPLVNLMKNKKMRSAIEKSNQISNVTKVSITGSFGKSSVKTYLSQLLGSKYNTLSTPENINTELGVSSVILSKLNKTYDYFIAETGAYKIGEISLLGKIVDHKYGFVTGIGNQHLGLFGSQENIKKGKFEILENVIKNKGKLYVNYDNTHIVSYLDENNIDDAYIRKYSMHSNDADIKGQITTIKDAITHFNVFINDEKYEFETKLIGSHNVLNLVGIVGFCFDIGMTYKEIIVGLQNVAAPKNTLEVSKKGNSIIIDDSYNLSEDGLFAGLDASASFGKDKKIYLVLDDILELGEESDKKHTQIAENIIKNYKIEKIHFVGSNYKKPFLAGLQGLNKENILDTKFHFLNNENIIYLFEGRNAGSYIKKIKT